VGDTDAQGGGRLGWGPAPGWRGHEPEIETEPAPPEPSLGVFIVIVSSLLIIAVCLPWATSTVHMPDIGLLPGPPDDVLGRSRQYTGLRGLPGMATILAALAAALLGGAGAVLGRRLVAYAAIPALTVLAALGLFAATADGEVEDKLYGDTLHQLPAPLGQLLRSTMETSLSFGWWLAVALALVVLGGAIVGLSRRPVPAAADEPAGPPDTGPSDTGPSDTHGTDQRTA
jgi:hypothetical protein